VGSWVRPRAGAYKNDLGRIYDVDFQANKCTVMLIPRLDYAGMAQRREEGRSLPFGRTNNNIRPLAKCVSPLSRSSSYIFPSLSQEVVPTFSPPSLKK
jgi:hypothetical protein